MHVDLEALRPLGLPPMPTTNGWLLGYPVVYSVADADEAQRASRCLSSGDLLLVTATGVCRAMGLAWGGAGAAVGVGVGTGGGAGSQQGSGTICAYSIPAELVPDAGVGLFRWKVMRAALDVGQHWTAQQEALGRGVSCTLPAGFTAGANT